MKVALHSAHRIPTKSTSQIVAPSSQNAAFCGLQPSKVLQLNISKQRDRKIIHLPGNSSVSLRRAGHSGGLVEKSGEDIVELREKDRPASKRRICQHIWGENPLHGTNGILTATLVRWKSANHLASRYSVSQASETLLKQSGNFSMP